MPKHYVLRDRRSGDYQSPRRLQVEPGKSRYSGHMASEAVGLEEARVFTTRAAASRAACDGFIPIEAVIVPKDEYERMAERAARYEDLSS